MAKKTGKQPSSKPPQSARAQPLAVVKPVKPAQETPTPSLMLGSHLSIGGKEGLPGALRQAESLGLATVQVFSKNQQQWRVRPLADSVVTEWRAEQARLGWNGRTVCHASYLINLASLDDELWRKSVDLMTVEIERCEQLGIAFLVHHPGSFTSATLDEGLARIQRAYGELFSRTRGYRTVSCLENTAGAGSTIGRRFEDLASLRGMIIEATGEAGRIGLCIDTCHAHAAGYDLSTAAGATAMLQQLDSKCGIINVRVLHLNDSKGAASSKLDRHEHIGLGTIGKAGFATVLAHPVLGALPAIMETPKGVDIAGQDWDVVNAAVLRSLVQPQRPELSRARNRQPAAPTNTTGRARAKGTGVRGPHRS